jgi:hypothetical protein
MGYFVGIPDVDDTNVITEKQAVRLFAYVSYFELGRKVTRLSKKSNLDLIDFCQSILYDKYYVPDWAVCPHINLEPFFKYDEWDRYLTYSDFLNKIELIYTKRPTRFWD